MKTKYNLWIGVIILMNGLLSNHLIAQDLVSQGKNNFTTHCSFCHHVGSVLVGPDLSNIDKRHSKEWIVSFVKSSQTMIKSGDKDAAIVFDKFKVVMPDQADLTESDINNIVSYISSESAVATVEKPPLATPFFAKVNNLPINKSNYPMIIFYLVLVSLLTMAMFFAVTVQMLRRNSKVKI